MGRLIAARLDEVANRLATLRARRAEEALVNRYQHLTAAELAQAWDEVLAGFDDEPLRPEWRNLTTAQLTAFYRELCEVE
jgi:hypothetical protein